MRSAMRVTAVLVPFFQGLNTGAYRISTAVQKNHERLSTCHRCIQHFVPYANFTYGAIKDDENDAKKESKSGILRMYADITDDIPFTYIEQSCNRGRKICSKLISNPDDFVPEEDKKLVNILRKTVRMGRDESSEAPRGIRLFGFDLNIRVSDAANNREIRSSGLDSRTYCLLLRKNIPELWILGCLRCLAPGDNDERYLISNPSTRNHQWVLRYTTIETQEDIMHRCGNSCGTIGWGSEIHWLVRHLYTSTQGVSSYISSFVYHNTELFQHTIRQSGTTSSIQKWSSLYHCVHHSFSTKSRSEYEDLVYTSNKKKSEVRGMTTCSRCLMSTVDWVVIKKALENFRLTSKRSALLFFSSPLDVQTFAIRCVKLCKFFNGLSENVCHFLREIEKLLPKDKAPSVTESRIFDGAAQRHSSLMTDHSLSPLPIQTNAEATLISAISHLESDPSEDSVWFFEFDITDGEKDGAFRKLAFCIAAVSNTYVLSSVSGYILTGRFEYSHVMRVCENRKISKVIHYRKLKVGFDLQPLNFEVVATILDLTTKGVSNKSA